MTFSSNIVCFRISLDILLQSKIQIMENKTRYVSIGEASNLTGYSKFKIRNFIKSGILHIAYVGKRKMLVKVVGKSLDWREESDGK